ncbi:DUF2924 domain-containing protein [Devosia sp. RR2S18]|uniref:DUF2924 domain-containing protein n=1 Tax=Devosia rhizosphaerae TaxID=3049774 RepID=UPI00253F9F37|nr:DUF2924 domain-containing protein [Devosia sp. RR2S18]WIJ25778.1 DUF2924 domain-containing protein [Devosia sp. RR2S18]
MTISPVAQIAQLRELPVDALKQRWRELFGSEPGPFNRRTLEDRLAYRLQELRFGGLSAQTLKRLEAMGQELDGGKSDVRKVRSDRVPQPGTRLVREWKGVEHTVTVLHDGFDYQGQPYKSLSPIAKRITGTSWNGLVFFGLKSGDRPHDDMCEPAF